MEKQIEGRLVFHLKPRNHMPQHEILKIISKELLCTEAEVSRIIGLMEDRGEIGRHDTAKDYLRLTNKGIEAHRPKKEKIFKYLMTNWVAIIGAITGITGTIISIIALTQNR